MSSMVNKDLMDTFRVCFVNEWEERERAAVRSKAFDAFNANLGSFFDQEVREKGLDAVYERIQVKFSIQFFGSSMFGGVDQDSDMDLLLLSYEDILNRHEFFYKFSDYLLSIGATHL